MSANNQENIKVKSETLKIYQVAIGLCLVCSVIVSSAAILLKERQVLNVEIDRKKNILMSAGLIKSLAVSPAVVQEKFEQIKTYLVDLDTGNLLTNESAEDFDANKALKDPKEHIKIDAKLDLASIKRRPTKGLVYVVKNGGDESEFSQIILPIHGKGLWSTMYGFLAIDHDLNTINGLSFFKHGETPGLGGEIDNPKWKSLWVGKKIHDDDLNLKIEVLKGVVTTTTPNREYKVDGLSGATITSRGVTNTLHYWLGQSGYGHFIEKLQSKEVIL